MKRPISKARVNKRARGIDGSLHIDDLYRFVSKPGKKNGLAKLDGLGIAADKGQSRRGIVFSAERDCLGREVEACV